MVWIIWKLLPSFKLEEKQRSTHILLGTFFLDRLFEFTKQNLLAEMGTFLKRLWFISAELMNADLAQT